MYISFIIRTVYSPSKQFKQLAGKAKHDASIACRAAEVMGKCKAWLIHNADNPPMGNKSWLYFKYINLHHSSVWNSYTYCTQLVYFSPVPLWSIDDNWAARMPYALMFLHVLINIYSDMEKSCCVQKHGRLIQSEYNCLVHSLCPVTFHG